MDAAGNFLVSYVGQDNGGSAVRPNGGGKGVLAQSFRSDGTRIGGEFHINPFPAGDQDGDVAAADPAGDFVVAWDAGDGDKSGVFARRFDTATPSCPASPQSGCLDAGRSELKLGQSAGGSLLWQWKGGPAFDKETIGNPVAGLTAFAICVYRANGPTTDLLVDASVDAAGVCNLRPCWTSSRTENTVSFKDKTGAANGITHIQLRGAPLGRGRISVKGSGPSLGLSLPVGPFSNVTAQIINGNGDCWQSDYDAARVNSPQLFSAMTK
jgi:hypothetical protein